MSKGFAIPIIIFIMLALTIANAQLISSASTAANSWTKKASMPTARAYLGVATVNGKIYAIGGSTFSETGSCSTGAGYGGDEVSSNEMYNPNTDTWVTKNPIPTARAAFGLVAYQSLIYCVGGYSLQGNNYGPPDTFPPYHDVAATEVYNPLTDTWTEQAPMPSPRYAIAANVVNGKIYVFGGWSMDSFAANQSVPNLTQVLDIKSNTWSVVVPPPLPLSSPASAVLDGKIYLLGQNQTWESNSVPMVYDSTSNNWTLGSSNIDDHIFAGAATSGVKAPKRVIFFGEKETHIYNPFKDNWTLGAPLLDSRLISSAVTADDTVYLIGGRTGIWGQITLEYPSGLNEQYTPAEYGTPDPSYLATITPPKISLLSIQANQTYENSTMALLFSIDKETSWIKYSLDGENNVTIAGNTTIPLLRNGLHNVTVYANDTYGNIGSSTISFKVEKPSALSALPVSETAAIVVLIAAIASSVTIYLKRRRNTAQLYNRIGPQSSNERWQN